MFSKILGLILLLLQYCEATNKAMIGEKRSETKDEFFIEKKNQIRYLKKIL